MVVTCRNCDSIARNGAIRNFPNPTLTEECARLLYKRGYKPSCQTWSASTILRIYRVVGERRNGREIYVIPPIRVFARISIRWKNYTGRNRKSIFFLNSLSLISTIWFPNDSTWFMMMSDLIRNKTIDWPIDFTLRLCKPESTFAKLSKMNTPTVIKLMHLNYIFFQVVLINFCVNFISRNRSM
jgi:hypothetical protein